MEGFNDVWANILNDKILAELTSILPPKDPFDKTKE